MDFARVLNLLGGYFSRSNQSFAVVGALGIAARGVGRTTFDVDIVARSEAQGRLIAFLESKGYRTDHRSSGYSNHVHEDCELGRIDVIYVSGETAIEIFEGVTMHDGPGGEVIPVPRVEHLAAMKLFAIKNNPQRVMQDLDDIGRILDLENVNRGEIRAYFQKYGLEDLLERLKG